MTRTETDLRAMYADVADVDPSAELMSRLDGVLVKRTVSALDARRGRRTRRAVVGIGLIAAVAAGVMLLVPSGSGGNVAYADPGLVLRGAAAAAAALPDVVPRADQFYYVKAGESESWYSVDGTHDGAAPRRWSDSKLAVIPGCVNGLTLTNDADGDKAVPCEPDPAYVADAPTNAKAMAAHLEQRYPAGTNGVGKAVVMLLEYHYLRPAARAAMFEALALIPHMTASTGGRLGTGVVGVSWSVTGSENEPAAGQQSATLLFDQRTHVYLGFFTLGVKGELGQGPPVSVTGFVDEVGQRP